MLGKGVQHVSWLKCSLYRIECGSIVFIGFGFCLCRNMLLTRAVVCMSWSTSIHGMLWFRRWHGMKIKWHCKSYEIFHFYYTYRSSVVVTCTLPKCTKNFRPDIEHGQHTYQNWITLLNFIIIFLLPIHPLAPTPFLFHALLYFVSERYDVNVSREEEKKKWMIPCIFLRVSSTECRR